MSSSTMRVRIAGVNKRERRDPTPWMRKIALRCPEVVFPATASYSNRMNFMNKSVVITGASAGIGRELAVELARRGALLTLAARGAEGLAEAARVCEAEGARAVTVTADVGERADCERIVSAAVEAHGGVDVLVNNAGISMWGRFDEIEDLSIFERIMRINYLGAVYCTHYALPHLKTRRGLIVAVSSLTGKTGVPTRSAYAASKHAMQGFFDSSRSGKAFEPTVKYERPSAMNPNLPFGQLDA